MSDAAVSGWAGLAEAAHAQAPEEARRAEIAFARCFSGDDGERALAHLRAITMERALGPGASDAAIRHLDAQRCLVLHIQSLIERGRNG